jgi:uncharacterized protein (TIGR03435 family)
MPSRITALLCASLILVASALAQTPAAKLPAWDVVSVHPTDLNSCTQGSGMVTTADGINIFCIPVLFVIEQAYLIREPNRIIGAPKWMADAMYDIKAKVSAEDLATYSKLGNDDRLRMLQSMLADRFRLKAHIESRELPIFELVVAKGGPKLKVPTPDEEDKARMMGGRGGKITAIDVPLTSLPWMLNNEVGRTVVDKTGLTGKYDFTLEYVPAAKAAADTSGGPSIFTALEEQLGLKLEPAKAQMDVLVVDSIDQPQAN